MREAQKSPNKSECVVGFFIRFSVSPVPMKNIKACNIKSHKKEGKQNEPTVNQTAAKSFHLYRRAEMKMQPTRPTWHTDFGSGKIKTT